VPGLKPPAYVAGDDERARPNRRRPAIRKLAALEPVSAPSPASQSATTMQQNSVPDGANGASTNASGCEQQRRKPPRVAARAVVGPRPVATGGDRATIPVRRTATMRRVSWNPPLSRRALLVARK
jgi:hypothetical protein